MMAVSLATTVHDPIGRFTEAIQRMAEGLRTTFPAMAFNVSDATRPEVLEALQPLGGRIMVHAAGESIIGKARRDSLALVGSELPALYSDFDHLLRWLEFGADDLERVLAAAPEIDCLVVGRTADAMAIGPRRLQETEVIVNHTFALLTGDCWDLMFAIRRLSPEAIKLILKEGQVDTLANDVEWPLLIRRAGLTLGYAESDALFYRTVEEFGDNEDTGDGDPLQWVRRIEFAPAHATAMRPFLSEPARRN
ncbi:hypothetical protein [Nisaea sp.]|uniref:hypothetical protein n=1 Tax=Nisaea sp. TaxID=2024842 RepID=UPI0032671FA0